MISLYKRDTQSRRVITRGRDSEPGPGCRYVARILDRGLRNRSSNSGFHDTQRIATDALNSEGHATSQSTYRTACESDYLQRELLVDSLPRLIGSEFRPIALAQMLIPGERHGHH